MRSLQGAEALDRVLFSVQGEDDDLDEGIAHSRAEGATPIPCASDEVCSGGAGAQHVSRIVIRTTKLQ
jgi:hypothetical protein